MPEVVARGVRFNVHLDGTGERLVVLIHGYGFDNSSSQYFLLAPALTPFCEVLSYDLRGHGLSEQPPTGYTLEDQALDLHEILDALGLGDRSATLVGTSMGGRIALAFAIRFPERVESIVLLDSEFTDQKLADEVAEVMERGPSAVEERLRELLKEFLDEHTHDGDLDHDAKIVKAFVETRQDWRRKTRLEKSADTLLWKTSFVEDIRRDRPLDWDELARIECPVLALYGERSDVIESGRRLAEVVPNCVLELVPGSGHFVIYKTSFVRPRLARWVAGLPTPV